MGGGASAGGGFDTALLAKDEERGFRGLFKNGRALGLACFASLGGVLYGYNQVCSPFLDRLRFAHILLYRVFSVKSKSCTVLRSDTLLL